jgi:hypothetical protein
VLIALPSVAGVAGKVWVQADHVIIAVEKANHEARRQGVVEAFRSVVRFTAIPLGQGGGRHGSRQFCLWQPKAVRCLQRPE